MPSASLAVPAAQAARGAPTGHALLREVGLILLALDLALLGAALAMGRGEVRDGAGSVTTGWVVAGGIVSTFALAAFIPLLPLPEGLRRQLVVFALGSQFLHAMGHLADLYYAVPGYDDALHFGVILWLALLGASFARELDVFAPRWRRAGVACAALLVGLAVAGAWEVFEFSADALLGTREQDHLADTMQDMVMGLLGSLAAMAASWTPRRPAAAPVRRALPKPSPWFRAMARYA